MTTEDIARICHAANAEYCRTLGDHSQKSWEDAPDWQRASCIDGVRFQLTLPHANPRASHDNWIAEKQKGGWTHGPIKDPVAKTHPCLVPYHELPAEQRLKDHIFTAIVHACRDSVPVDRTEPELPSRSEAQAEAVSA